MSWRWTAADLIDRVRDGVAWVDTRLAALEGNLLANEAEQPESLDLETWFHGPIRSGPDPLRRVSPQHPSMRPHRLDPPDDSPAA